MRLIYIADRTHQHDPQPGGSRVRIRALLAFLTVVCIAALAWGVSGARIAVTVVFGGLLAVLILGWIVTSVG
jgi:L-lactate permease